MLKENGTCRTLCHVPDVTGDDAKFINDRIREDYAINWLIDGLPAAEMKVDTRTKELFFDMGFNLGDNEGKRQNLPALNNHYEIVLRCVKFSSFQTCTQFPGRYHRPTPTTYRVVGVLVWPARYLPRKILRLVILILALALEVLKQPRRIVISKMTTL